MQTYRKHKQYTREAVIKLTLSDIDFYESSRRRWKSLESNPFPRLGIESVVRKPQAANRIIPSHFFNISRHSIVNNLPWMFCVFSFKRFCLLVLSEIHVSDNTQGFQLQYIRGAVQLSTYRYENKYKCNALDQRSNYISKIN